MYVSVTELARFRSSFATERAALSVEMLPGWTSSGGASFAGLETGFLAGLGLAWTAESECRVEKSLGVLVETRFAALDRKGLCTCWV